MKKSHLLFLLLLLIVSFDASAQKKNKTKINDSIPFLLGIHNEFEDKESLKIEFIDSLGKSTLIHEGMWEGWGMYWMKQKIQRNKYNILISWKDENKIKKVLRPIVFHKETEYFSLNIELANDLENKRVFNAVYFDQYTKPLNDVVFTRNWDPQYQFGKDTLLVPDYLVTNNSDSTIYGAYLRHSSQLSINWVQTHYIAFMRFEQKTGNEWEGISCNAPRINMKLKKGESGKTLTDMRLGCQKQNFEIGKPYRVIIEYMLNDRIFEKNQAPDGFEELIFVEQRIYTYSDEFTLK